MNDIKITCISENTNAFHHSLLNSHGQSLLLEIDSKKYLFDVTEIYEGFMYNMENLELKIEDIDSIVLSHNHLDHAGALYKLVDQLTDQGLYLPPDMMTTDEQKYNKKYRAQDREAAIQKLLDYKNTKIIDEGKKIDENIYTTGALEAVVKEQSIIINIPQKGLVVLIGCGHPSLPSIIDAAKKTTGEDKIYGIIGGLHYARSTPEEITEYVKYIKSLDLEFIVPSHCTGYQAVQTMQQLLGDKVHISSVGGQFGTGNSVVLLPELKFILS